MLIGHWASEREITKEARLPYPRAWTLVQPGLPCPASASNLFRPAGLQRTDLEGTSREAYIQAHWLCGCPDTEKGVSAALTG